MAEIISILVPTLNRPANVESLSLSVNQTVKEPSAVEIVYGIHEDDAVSRDKIGHLSQNLAISLRIAYISRYPDGKPHLSDLWNQIYAQTLSPILGFFGDDVVFETPCWDEAVRAELADKTLLFACNDYYVNRGEPVITLFFTHRMIHEHFGFYMYPRFRRWFMDTFWARIYGKFGKARFHKEIITKHYHPDCFPARRDKVYEEMHPFRIADNAFWYSREMERELEKYYAVFEQLLHKETV